MYMTTDRKSVLSLYEHASCQGEYRLFSSPSRNAHDIARTRCASCPVIALCKDHVRPEDGFTGTVAGRLYYDGKDVTEDRDALPPPNFRANDVDPELAAEIKEAFISEDADWSIYNESTLMAAIWFLRKSGFRASRISRVSGLSRDRIAQLALYFEEEAPSDLKDFLIGFES